jgi:hypothetical protein
MRDWECAKSAPRSTRRSNTILSFLIADQRAVDGIKQLIEQMEAEKAALHPEQE